MKRSGSFRWAVLAALAGAGLAGHAAGQEPENPLRFGELHIQPTPLADAGGWPDSRGAAGANESMRMSDTAFSQSISAQFAQPPAGHDPAPDIRRLPLPEAAPLMRDDQVRPASLDAVPAGPQEPEAAGLSLQRALEGTSGRWNARPREAGAAGRQPFAGPAGLEVSGSIRQLAFATLVSLLGVVVIVVVNKTLRRNQGSARTPAGEGPRVEQTLALGNKSLLRVVRVGKQQVLVATDATGIRSMVPVPGEFAAFVEEPLEEQVTPEQEQFFNHLMERLNSRPRQT